MIAFFDDNCAVELLLTMLKTLAATLTLAVAQSHIELDCSCLDEHAPLPDLTDL